MTNSKYRYESARLYRREYNEQYYAKTAYARNHRQPWTKEDLIAVKNHDIPDQELSKKLGRSVRAIQVVRNSIKKGKYNYYGI